MSDVDDYFAGFKDRLAAAKPTLARDVELGLDATELIPPEKILKPLVMSIHTFQAQLKNLNVPFKDLFEKLKDTLHTNEHIYALHCNFGHAEKLDDDSLKKIAKKVKRALGPSKKARKVHGDGTSFQACLEIWIKIDHPEVKRLAPNKIYKLKCFSTTGKIQIPGGRLDNDEDCDMVIKILIDYLNENNVSEEPVELVSTKTAMKNFKSGLILDDPTLDLFNYRVSRYIKTIQDDELDKLEGVYVKPPYKITNTLNPDECSKSTFRFVVDDSFSGFRCEMFNNISKKDIGKINFKGVKCREQAEAAYQWLEDIFRVNWNLFIGPRPKVDPPMRSKKGIKMSVDYNPCRATEGVKPTAAEIMKKVSTTPKIAASAAPLDFDDFDLDLDDDDITKRLQRDFADFC